MQIQLNQTGTHSLQLTEENCQTIRRYHLLQGLVGSSGYVTETELNKLKLHIRSLIAHSQENTTDLLNLCIDVVYHDKMKAFGLSRLIDAYKAWEAEHPEPAEPGSESETAAE